MIHIQTEFLKTTSDLLTPIRAFLNIRNNYAISVLLEAADYHGRENHFSYIAFNPLLSLQLETHHLIFKSPYFEEKYPVEKGRTSFISLFQSLMNQMNYDRTLPEICHPRLIGYTQYDFIEYIEDIELKKPLRIEQNFPLFSYHLYEYLIIFDHYYNQLYLIHHSLPGFKKQTETNLTEILHLIQKPVPFRLPFSLEETERSDFTSDEFMALVQKAKYHVQRGDVFQLVLSNGYQQHFSGDDFQVYRTLRNLNPSPYMFYFDMGTFHLLGSSPESQIKINHNTAIIHPIAGTFPRSGNDAIDRERAQSLLNNEKEMAEHVMLVDLARNDLSKHCRNVHLEYFHEVQYYSHVIHLVSEVRGELIHPEESFQVLFDTFPAGTLTGAPKYRAMELIDIYEKKRRAFYGGAIGIIGLNGNSNLAIFIRSALSYQNTLYFQAGAGIVADSIPENEAREIISKSDAIRRAISETTTVPKTSKEIHHAKNSNY